MTAKDKRVVANQILYALFETELTKQQRHLLEALSVLISSEGDEREEEKRDE